MATPRPTPTPRRRGRLAVLLDPGAPTLVYVGIALIVIGFVLLAVAWGNVAGYLDVGDQVPYLISGGFSGLGLIVVGAGTLVVSVMRAEAARRQREADQILDAVRELRARLGESTTRPRRRR